MDDGMTWEEGDKAKFAKVVDDGRRSDEERTCEDDKAKEVNGTSDDSRWVADANRCVSADEKSCEDGIESAAPICEFNTNRSAP